MKENNHKLTPEMAADLRRLQQVRAVLSAVKERNQVQRDAPSEKPSDVAKRLVANQAVRAVARKLIS